MKFSSSKVSRNRRVTTFAILLCVFLLPYQCDSYTEVFSITQDSDDNTYFVGNRDSNFFIGKKNSFCALQWESTAGSTSGDDNDDGNSEVLYDAVVGQDGAVYSVGSTHGSFSSPSNEVPNLDAAVVVYDSSSGDVIQQKQYDVPAGLDNVAQAISRKANGNFLVAVYGSVPNIESIATYETRILEIDSETLEIQEVYEIVVTTTENVFSITGGPKLLDFIYEESTDSIIALGHILGRGLLWKHSFNSETAANQAEWGEAFGNFQISAFTSDGNGAYYVVGSSSERVLENDDLQTTVSAEFHAYVIRFDNLDSSNVSPTWVRQLAGSGSSQSGSDIAIDPVTGDIVVVGEFDADFTITDVQTSETFTLNLSTDDGITDVFLWYLDAPTGDFKELRSSSMASTNSEDRGNAVSILSRRTVQIGGITNDGDDSASTVCDRTNTLPSSTPSSSPSPSVTPSSTPSTSSSPSSSPSPSQTVSPTMSSSKSGTPSPTSTASPSRFLLSPGASTSPSSPPFSSAFGTLAAISSPSPLTSRLTPSSSTSPTTLQVSASKTPSSLMMSNPSETSESSFAEQISQIASLDTFESAAESSEPAVPASLSETAEASRVYVSSESLFVALDETADSNGFVGPLVSAEIVIEDAFNAIASTAPTPAILDQEELGTSSNAEISSVMTMETEVVGKADEVTNAIEVSRSQEVTSSGDISFIDIDETPTANEPDASATESPEASSNAVLITFLSATPSSSSSPFPSVSVVTSLSPTLSQRLGMDEDPSVSASLFDFSPQSTPQAIPSMTFVFVSADLGTPTPSPSPSIFTASTSDSSREAPSRAFDFIVVDLDVSFSPSTSSLAKAVVVNLISPTPSSSKTALMVNSGTITPGLSPESSPVSENDGKAEASITMELSGETLEISSDPELSSSAENLAPDEDDLIAQISIMPESSKLFSSDVAASNTEASPTIVDVSIDPSSTLRPIPTMTQTSGDEEDMMKSELPSVESSFDETVISPLFTQVGETAAMNPPEASMTMTPLVSEVAELYSAASSPNTRDVDVTSEARFTSDTLHMHDATPEDTDDILVTMTGLAQIEISPSLTIFDTSTEPLASPLPKITMIFSLDDDDSDDEEDMMRSSIPSLESRIDEVKETPLFTQKGNAESMNSPELTFEVTAVFSESAGTLTMESPMLLGSSDEPGLRPSETLHVSEEKSLFVDISSSPDSDAAFTDFLQSPEPSHAMTEISMPPEFSNAFDGDASFVTISQDVKSSQEIQPSGNTLEPSTLMSSEFFTPAVSAEVTEEGLNTEIESTQPGLVQQTTAEIDLPNESMENHVGFTNSPGPFISSSDAEDENEILQTSVEDELRMGDSSPTTNFNALHTDEEDILEAAAKRSLAPDDTGFTEPLSTLSPSVFATEFAGSSEIPDASSQSIAESEGQDILASDASQGPFISASISDMGLMPLTDTEDEFESSITASVSASSEVTNPQGSADTEISPAASSEETQFTGIGQPENSFEFEQQIASTTPESSAQVTAEATFSSSSEQSTQVPSALQTTKSFNAFIEVPSPSEEPELQQGAQSNVFVVSETSSLPSEQPSPASIETPIEFIPHGTVGNIAFTSTEAQTELSVTPGAGGSNGEVNSQEPNEGLHVELRATPDETTISASQMQKPTPTSESLTKATTEASRTPDMAGFTPGLAASVLVESPESENSRSSGTASRTATPSVAETSLVFISVSATSTPSPSKSIAVEAPTPTTTQVIPREPVFSFIDIVFPSATPSSSPTIRTGTISASSTPNVATSISPDVSRASPSSSPASSGGITLISPSIDVGIKSSTPSVSTNPSEVVLILLPSATPSSSIAVFIVLPSATPSSSLAVKGSNTAEPSSTTIESQQIESSLPTATERFPSTPVENPEESNLLPSPFVSQSTSTQNPSPSSADRGFLTTAPSFPGFETPFTSRTPLPVESSKSSFSQAPATSAIPSPSTADISPALSTGSPTSLPSRSSQASLTGTQGLVPSTSNQPSTLETPAETISVSILPSSIAIPTQSLSSPSQPPSLEAPTREPLESAQPSSLESSTFKPSISSLPSFVGNTTEIPSVSSQPTAQGSPFPFSPSISGNIIGFTSQTFLIEPSAFQSMDLSLPPSGEANFEEPTASLLPSQTEPVSSETAENTEVPGVSEEISVQTPTISQDMDEREEKASLTLQAIPSFSEEVEFSTVPSFAPSPSSAPTASVQLTASSSASPTTSISASSSRSPASACVDDGSIVVDPDSLNQTRNFQRVNMVIQVAGPNLTGSCQFTRVIAERFILLSAINTLSQADMWRITSIENGPSVFEEESSLVGIEDGDSLQGDLTVVSPSPSRNATKRTRFEGSVIFNVTAFMDSLSVELASGSYVEYISSQNIVKVMTAEGFNDIQWTGMISAPRVIDVQVQEEDARVGSRGLTSGEISAVAIGMLLIIGVAAFVIVEGGISTRRSGAILPI